MDSSTSRSTSRSHTIDPVTNGKLTPNKLQQPLQQPPQHPRDFNSVCYSCPATKILNSRRKKPPGFALQPVQTSSQPTPQFIQPSKVYSRARYPATPPSATRSARQKQIQLQPSKAEVAKNNTSRRDKLKPYVLEPPVQAQRFPKSKTCDFYPWKGNHPEDHVTETQARNGQFDKLFVGKNNNEQASARASLAPTFKQRMGLRTLSSLYLTIMVKRQAYSTVTTSSTFKPPPRVTLPEQKREAWLRDLANPLVPLRKLSRTIPHGLKGPPLLDQCAAKNVPTARAVWFVRCVGANELRGLRRKGVGSLAVGGEAKWIKEWTGQVTQFLEKVVGACNTMTDDWWQSKMHYSVRLASHLYAEHLLDRTAFLDWYLSFLEACSMDVLPFVFVLATVFWDDIMKLRRFARRFTEILLVKSDLVVENNVDYIFMPLLHRLSIMASNVLLCHPDSLVGSGDLQRLIKNIALFDGRFSGTELYLQNVSLRNRYLDGSNGTVDPSTSTISVRRRAVDYLDNIALPFNSQVIYQELNCLLPATELVACIFEWAVSSLRTGRHRVYLAAELLRYASMEGLAIQTSILEFLASLDMHIKVKKHDVYLLIAELVRTEYFSIAGYMRWLIAKGGYARIDSLDESCPCYVRLLAELPIHSASTTLKNLRRTLLNGCSFDCSEEERSVIQTREMLSNRGIFNMPPNIHADRYAGLSQDELERVRTLTRTAKSELALWIKESFEELFSKYQTGRDGWRGNHMDANSLPVTQMILARQVLEEMGEIAVLVDIVTIALGSENWDILTLAADTINFNLETFSVLHSLEDFKQQLFLRFKKLQTEQALDKQFLTSFLELLTVTGTDSPMRQELDYELATYYMQYHRTAIAHSPISESMDDIFDDGDLDNNEEIDRLWNTRATVDKQNLSRIFEMTVSTMETSFEDTDNQLHIISATKGLTKLRQFDPDVFDELSHHWVLTMQAYSNRFPLFRAFSSLVAASCLKIETLADVASRMLTQHNEGAISPYDGGKFVALVLDLIIHDDAFETALSAKDFYTLKRKRKSFVTISATCVLGLFRQVIELCSISQDEDLRQHVLRLVSSGSTMELLRGLATQRLDLLKAQVVDPLLQAGNISWLQTLFDNLLDDNYCNDSAEVDPHVQVGRLLDLANDFSIGLCKLKMQIILNVDPKTASFGVEDVSTNGNTIARSFIRGIASASHDRRKICTDLVTVLNKDCAGKIRTDVEDLFLDWNTFLQTHQLIEQLDLSLAHDHETGESLARAFLSVVEATSSSPSTSSSQQLGSLLVERLAKLLQVMSAQEDETSALSNLSWRNRDAFSELSCWFVLFMKLVVLHRTAFTQAKSLSPDPARMLAGLCCLLQHDTIRSEEAHFDLVLSIAAIFCDALPDDTRLQLKRYLKGKRAVPMSSYLVGAGDGMECLKAFQRGKMMEFAVKPWERLAEPTPSIGENDVSLSLALFKTRRF